MSNDSPKKPVPWWAVDLPIILILSAGMSIAFSSYTGMKLEGGMFLKSCFISVVLGSLIGSGIRKLINASRGATETAGGEEKDKG